MSPLIECPTTALGDEFAHMAQHEEQHELEDAARPETEADVDHVLTSIEQELSALVSRCEQTTAQHARELTQRQAEIDRSIQIALKRQIEIDRQSAELRALGDEVARAESHLTERKRRLAERLRRRRQWMDDRLTAAVDTHARQASEQVEARARELADREAALARAADQTEARARAAAGELERLKEVRELVDEQASLTARHMQEAEALLAKREHAALELVERLSDACGLADRVRELSEQVRESRLEARESAERAEQAERDRTEARSALDAARARIAQLESRMEGLSREKLLLEQRLHRRDEELTEREAKLSVRERRLQSESRRLAEDQAACDAKLRELGSTLSQHDRRQRERRLDPRTPLPVSSMPLPVSPRRRPELRLVR